MKIIITCGLEDPDAEHADRLLPYLAAADVRGLESRAESMNRAIANVKGIALHWLGDMPDPPSHVVFEVKRLYRPV